MVASKLVTANKLSLSPKKTIGVVIMEKVFSCLFSWNSTVSCSWTFVCSISVSVCFVSKSNNPLFVFLFEKPGRLKFVTLHFFWILLLLCFQGIFKYLVKFSCFVFLKCEAVFGLKPFGQHSFYELPCLLKHLKLLSVVFLMSFTGPERSRECFFILLRFWKHRVFLHSSWIWITQRTFFTLSF